MKRMLMCFVLLMMATAVQAQSSNVDKTIAGMEQQWTEGAKAGNTDAVAPLLADNFVNMDSDGSVHGKAETLSRLKGSH